MWCLELTCMTWDGRNVARYDDGNSSIHIGNFQKSPLMSFPKFTGSLEMPSMIIRNTWNSWDPPMKLMWAGDSHEMDEKWWYQYMGSSESSIHEFPQFHWIFGDAKYDNRKILKWRLHEIYPLDWCELVILMSWTKCDERRPTPQALSWDAWWVVNEITWDGRWLWLVISFLKHEFERFFVSHRREPCKIRDKNVKVRTLFIACMTSLAKLWKQLHACISSC